MHRIGRIYDEALAVFARAQQSGANTAHIANKIAEERFQQGVSTIGPRRKGVADAA
jgi:hypothetical protein